MDFFSRVTMLRNKNNRYDERARVLPDQDAILEEVIGMNRK